MAEHIQPWNKIHWKVLNLPDTYIRIYHGQKYVITETDKNKAIDEDGNTWTFEKEWKKDYIPNERPERGETIME